MAISTTQKLTLEPAAQAFADANANPPFLTDLGPENGRRVLDQVQSEPGVARPDVEVEDFMIPGGPHGEVQIHLLKPVGTTGPLPVILYLHGAGWVFGDPLTHDRLVRELCVGTGAAVVFPALRAFARGQVPDGQRGGLHGRPVDRLRRRLQGPRQLARGRRRGLLRRQHGDRGDADGQGRGGAAVPRQALFYPVTDANFDTPSYEQFAEGFHLRRDMMQWFWDQYTTDPDERAEITASPRRATPDQLRDLPPALVINGEADVLRDEGEAYAELLREAGNDVQATRYAATIHDFMMLDALRDTEAAKAATAQAIRFISERLA